VKAGGKQSLAGFLLGLFFDPEDGGDMFLRNVDSFSTDYTALHPRRYTLQLVRVIKLGGAIPQLTVST
jgi:hypothetical protein